MLQDYFGFQGSKLQKRVIPRTETSRSRSSKHRSMPRTEKKFDDPALINKINHDIRNQSSFNNLLKLKQQSRSQSDLNKYFINNGSQREEKSMLRNDKKTMNKEYFDEVLFGKKKTKSKCRGKRLFRHKIKTSSFLAKNDNKKKLVSQQNSSEEMLLQSVNRRLKYPFNPQQNKKNTLIKKKQYNPYGLRNEYYNLKTEQIYISQQCDEQIRIQIKPIQNYQKGCSNIGNIEYSSVNQIGFSQKTLIDVFQEELKQVDNHEPVSELLLSSKVNQEKHKNASEKSIFYQYINPLSLSEEQINHQTSNAYSNYQQLLDPDERAIEVCSLSKIGEFQKQPACLQSSVREVKEKLVIIQRRKNSQIQRHEDHISQSILYESQNQSIKLERGIKEQLTLIQQKIQIHLQKLQSLVNFIQKSKEIYDDKSFQDCRFQNFLLYKYYYFTRQAVQSCLKGNLENWCFILPHLLISKSVFMEYQDYPEIIQLSMKIGNENVLFKKNVNIFRSFLSDKQTKSIQVSEDIFSDKQFKFLLKELHEEYFILCEHLQKFNQERQQESESCWIIFVRIYNLMQLVILISYLENHKVGSLYQQEEPQTFAQFENYQHKYQPIVKQIFLDFI